jgi:hypothetical protein
MLGQPETLEHPLRIGPKDFVRNYDAEASPDSKWVEVSDAGEAAFRKRDAEAKA